MNANSPSVVPSYLLARFLSEAAERERERAAAASSPPAVENHGRQTARRTGR